MKKQNINSKKFLLEFYNSPDEKTPKVKLQKQKFLSIKSKAKKGKYFALESS